MSYLLSLSFKFKSLDIQCKGTDFQLRLLPPRMASTFTFDAMFTLTWIATILLLIFMAHLHILEFILSRVMQRWSCQERVEWYDRGNCYLAGHQSNQNICSWNWFTDNYTNIQIFSCPCSLIYGISHMISLVFSHQEQPFWVPAAYCM